MSDTIGTAKNIEVIAKATGLIIGMRDYKTVTA